VIASCRLTSEGARCSEEGSVVIQQSGTPTLAQPLDPGRRSNESQWAASWPLVWILLSPFFAEPFHWSLVHRVYDSGACVWTEEPGTPGFMGAVGGYWACPSGDMLITLLPGVLIFLALFGLLQPGLTRRAATFAGILAAFRFLAPIAAYRGADTIRVEWQLVGPPTVAPDVTAVSVMLWLCSLVVLVAFVAYQVASSRREQRMQRAGAESR
jgi:hypothetical protein